MRWRALGLAVLGSGCSLILPVDPYLADAGRDGGQVGMDAGDAGDPPDSGDPGDAGDGGSPSVIVVSGVGLTSYRPMPGETLRAVVGPARDGAGRPVVPEIVWLRNGERIAGASGASLRLDAATYAAGDEIRVELHHEGRATEASATALVVADDVTRWRRLIPTRSIGVGFLQLDAARQRLLLWSRSEHGDHGLWEQQLTESGHGPWVELYPSGERPSPIAGAPIYDRDRHRILYFGGLRAMLGTSELYELSLAERGRERWSERPLAVAPEGRYLPAVALAADGARAFIYGGVVDDPPTALRSDLWELDFASTELTRIAADHARPTALSVLLHDAARDRLLIVGGVGADGETPSADIEIVDLASPSPTFEPSGSSLPMPLFGAATVIEGDRALLFLGAHDFDAFNEQRFELALDDLSTTAAPLSGVPPTATGTAWSRAPFDPDFLVHATPLFQVLVDVRELAPGGDTLRPFGGTGIDLPLPTQDAVMAFRNDPGGSVLTVVGGREAFDRVWRMQESGAWAPFTITPDERGLSPTLRGAAPYDGSHPQEGRVWQVLGDTTGGVADSLDVWRTEGDQWQQLTFLSTSPVPSGRGASTIFRGCPTSVSGRRALLGVTGGVIGFFVLSDTVLLTCQEVGFGGTPVDCEWRSVAPTALQGGLVHAAATVAGPRAGERDRWVYLFGGERSGLPPSNLLWALDPCTEDPAEEWVEVTLSDTRRPDARFGHTMTHVPAAGGDDTEPSTILIFGGAGGGDTYFSDVWRLVPVGSADGAHVARFEPLTPAGDAPIGRMRHSAVYDPEQRRLIVFGGVRGFATLDDAWELRLRD